MNITDWALLILLSILWGGSFFFVEIAVGDLPPFTIVFLRVSLAALALLIGMRLVRQQIPNTGRIWRAFFVMGLINNFIPFTLIVWGQTEIASGLASILNATTPLFTVLVAHFWTSDEKMTGGRLAGVLIGLLGVAVMIGPDALAGLTDNLIAQLAVMGAALSYAFAGVYGRRFQTMGVAPVATATGQLTASACLLLPVMLWVDQPWNLTIPPQEVWLAIVALALLSTSLAYIIYFRILSTSGATNLLLVTFLIPVSAILLGVTILGEILQSRHFTGMIIIGLGLAAIDGRASKLLKLNRK